MFLKISQFERFVALYAADNSGIPKVSAAFKYSYCADTPNSPSDLVALRKNMVRPSAPNVSVVVAFYN